MTGTNFNETIISLDNGDIIRLIGNGWHPRKVSLEIIQPGTMGTKGIFAAITITGKKDLISIASEITKFLKIEKKYED